MNDELTSSSDEYVTFLTELKARIQTAQARAALAVNRELVLLYWQIGRDLSQKMQRHGWGAKTIDRIAADLKLSFPGITGFSPRNLRYMRSFADAYPDENLILQAPLAKLTWYHNLTLLEKLTDPQTRRWYAQKTVENGWSRNVLVHHIESRLHERQGRAIHNFESALPSAQSELASQLLKDPYTFDFLTLHDQAVERDLERGLLVHLQKFLLELGTGFAFIGSQVPLTVSEKEYYIDLLFYHVRLHCYVVVELKMRAFEPEFAGKMNFYLAALDRQVRDPKRDERSIGLILCKSHDRLTVEYALYDTATPIGVSEYRLAEALPDTLKGSLPTVAQLEAELAALPDAGEPHKER